MQAPDQNKRDTQDELTRKVEQQLELSEAWRQLLGLEAQPAPSPASLEVARAAGAVNQEAMPVLAHDPWRSLAREQGIQVVDLQQAPVHKAQDGDTELEHALDMMQEQDKKPEK